MNWLLAPVVPRHQWKKIAFKEKRAITLQEHQLILGDERNAERRLFYRQDQ
jgi:hypothetical protein